MHRLLSLAALLFVLSLAPPFANQVAAQDCGWHCDLCGIIRHEGRNYATEWAFYNMGCVQANWCNACKFSLAEAPLDGTDLANQVVRVEPRELEALLRVHGDRLYVYPARGVVAVRGGPCDERAIVAVAFPSVGRMQALVGHGIRPLEALPEVMAFGG